MKRMAYKSIIKKEWCDVKTLVVADDEADALVKAMVKFKDLEYIERDVSIHLSETKSHIWISTASS